MSRRGGGRGGGGRRSDNRSEQQNPSPAFNRGGGGGGGRDRGGGGRGRGRGYEQGDTQPRQQPAYQATSSSSAYQATSSASAYPPPADLNPVGSVSEVESLRADVEQRLTVKTPETEVSSPAPSSSKAVRFPVRPGFGTLGRKCVVRANHFLVELADKPLHHYDVSIAPEVTSKGVCRAIMRQFVEDYRESHLGRRTPAYDGRKSMYTAGALPFESKEFVVKLVDKDKDMSEGGSSRRDRQFKVTIKFAAKPDLSHLQQFLRGRQHDAPQETIQALDVVLRETPSMNYTVVGRSFFAVSLGVTGELGDGLMYWKGYYQSLRPTQMGLSLNIDVSARSFYEPIPVTEFVAQLLNARDLSRTPSDQDRVKIKRALRGIKIDLTRHPNVRRYKITGISPQPLNQLTFLLDGTKTYVVQYFREKYGISLKSGHLPALQAGPDSSPTYLPMELCKIVAGQRYTKKLNERQVTALLRATCQRPRDREGSIKKMLRTNDFNRDFLVSNEFGIQVSDALTSVDARVLQPPTLKYHDTGKEKSVNPSVGQWNMINKKMVNGGVVECWTLVNFSKLQHDQADMFCDELLSMCVSKGMTFNPEPVVPLQSARSNQIEKTLMDIYTKSNAKLAGTGKHLQLLIIILPDMTGSYGKIKRICETELGIVSQCCQPRQASKLSKQYMENVSLKINVKVGGRNTVLADAINRRIPFVSDMPTIIFGADVTHPHPGEDSSPSIASVVASMDWPEVTKYRGLVSAQEHRVEIISDLYKTVADPQRGTVHSGMIRELLISFRRATGQKPHRIIFYRDGVSEGQFSQVLLYEMDAIRKACTSLEENYLPPVTFIVVQKRHHTRLFPANHDDKSSTDRSGNILAGTVIDTKICHPTEFDFYLCSHAGIQGTSRPAHYHVLYDENRFNADALQSLTNNLCYTYARCTRSVSIVPPAYYAHLAAFRARYYIEGDTSDGGSTPSGHGGATTYRPLPTIKDNVKDVMFYC